MTLSHLVIVIILTILSFILRLAITGLTLVSAGESALNTTRKVAGDATVTALKVTGHKKTATGIKAVNTGAGAVHTVTRTGLKVATKGLKIGLRFLQKVISRLRDIFLISLPVMLAIELAILIIFLASSAGFLSLYAASKDGVLAFNEETLGSLGTTGSMSTDGEEGSSESGSSSNVTKPEGISDASWNSADETGKKVALFAYNAIIDPPNGTAMKYQQGNTPVGVYDCSTFVCAVLEGSMHKTFSGKDCSGYDFKTNCKGDLAEYSATKGMQSIVNSKPGCKKGLFSNNPENAQPGDVFLVTGHVMIYVGCRDDGTHIIAHASTQNGKCSSDIALTDRNLDVGFSEVWSKNSEIIRTSVLLGTN